ncbi:TRAP transporter small permease [Kaustia mangrovi]|uniref:TRAP transporter small permease protein n=1 Tax=Kaustia mangrovi TaxID=2593653 RepID=A0A7S8C3R4_9HYPH|nr:TRAP transporter small permease [Kaustia mangrovi]QPC42848.1 TRAP transporter small permease [Kaustia mangrovi]
MKQSTIYLALAGTAALVVAVMLTVADIVLRTATTLTVEGLTDIVTLCTMIGAMLAIPYGFATDSHVSIDVFTSRMPERAQRWLRLLAACLGAAFLAGVFWFSTRQALTELSYGDRSQSIGIPMIWYWLPLLAGVAIAAAVNLWLVVRILRGRDQR